MSSKDRWEWDLETNQIVREQRFEAKVLEGAIGDGMCVERIQAGRNYFVILSHVDKQGSLRYFMSGGRAYINGPFTKDESKKVFEAEVSARAGKRAAYAAVQGD